MLVAALAGCSSDPVPPLGIDAMSETASIDPAANQGPADVGMEQTYPAPVEPVTQTTDSMSDNTVAVEEPVSQAPLTDPGQNIEETGIPMDEGLGVQPGTSLAEDQANFLAEDNPSQPVVDGIGTDNPTMLNPGQPVRQTIDPALAEENVTLPQRRVNKTGEETEVAFVPRFSDPMQVPETMGGMSAAEKNCRQQLKRLGVRFTDLEPIRDGASCQIPHPVKLSGFTGGIEVKPAATLNCPTALAFAKWVRNEVVPSARVRYLSGVRTIHQMSSYSCRRMNSKRSNPWSEHARGNAIDIGKFVLKNGKVIEVEKKGIFAFREKGLLKAVRVDSCRYFNTVLGPGSDVFHKDHFHFDLRSRSSGRRHCDI